MAGMTMQAAKSVYEQQLKAQILKTMKDAFNATFLSTAGGEAASVAEQMSLKFATECANGLSGPICETIVNIVSQAQITGTSNGVTVGTCAVGPTAGTSTNIFTGQELSLV
jgi:hypothetical protein